MDSVEAESCEDQSGETGVDELALPGSPITNEIYDEPPVCSRIGNQYQAEIPALATESEHLRMLNINDPFGIGLAIPIIWIRPAGYCMDDEKSKILGSKINTHEAGSAGDRKNNKNIYDYAAQAANCGKNNESQSNGNCSITSGFPTDNPNRHIPQGLQCKVKFSNDAAHFGKEFVGSFGQEQTNVDNQLNMSFLSLEANYNSPLPGLSPSPSWSDTEIQSFVLGLYIFGKDLVQVSRFMESKKMGDMLSFYYGKFYRSDAHCRWSECRKIRSRKCILGQRIFTGWRQQELLSRVLPTVSKEVQDTLLEATKAFNEGRGSFEEFVFFLKATVGMQVLIEAIGIGEGKHDLTGIMLDPVRTNQAISARPEIPIGKACSSLTSGDIIKFLTGDFRLSKARSNDLFWEAVWPRLLARGWHSEQPKDLNSVSSKQTLVFIIPGVKKFSRRKLVKGNHYFDSVSDVLNKVASDPWLLELDVDGAKGSSSMKDENGWALDTKSDQNGFSGHRRHCYLRPRFSNCNPELMKFTVVDTSLVQGDGPLKVRELRSLPVDATHNYGPSGHSEETGSGSSAEQPDSDDSSSDEQGQGDSALGILDDKKREHNRSCTVDEGMQLGQSNQTVSVLGLGTSINGHTPDNQCSDSWNENQLAKDAECQFSCRLKSSKADYLSPVSKRRRLTACKYEGAGRRTYSFSKDRQRKKEEMELEQQKTSDIVSEEAEPLWGKLPASSSIGGSIDENKRSFFGEDCYETALRSETVVCKEMSESCALIDLNLPHIPQDYENVETFGTEIAGSQYVGNLEEPAGQPETQQHDGSETMEISNGVPGDQQPPVNSRRQSTRIRPPTTKALEALACGFIGTKRRGRDAKPPQASRPSRRVRKTVETSVPVTSTKIDSVTSASGDSNDGTDECYGGNIHNTSMLSESNVQPERKGLMSC